MAVTKAVERADGILDLPDKASAGLVERPVAQCADEHAERVHRLPEIVAGGSEKTRLGEIGRIGHFLLALEIVGEIQVCKLQLKRVDQQSAKGVGQHSNNGHPEHGEDCVGPVEEIAV